jgi:YVTN family beta-propeller protein
VIRQWIDDGAPSRDGRIPFSNAESRIFTTNQDSDVVAVVDEKSLLAMRVFPVGLNVAFESPHGLQISPDGRYFYVSMIVGQTVLKFEASNGLFVDSVNLGKPLALIKLSSDGSKLYVTTNFDINNPAATSGQVTIIRTADMTTIKQIGIGINPHGINLSRDGILLYVTAVNSDEIYVIDTRSDTVITSFTADSDPSPDPDFEPYHVALSQKNADGYEDYIFVTCRKDGKMRIFQRESNTVTSQHSFSLIGSIPVGLSSLSKPIQMDVTPDGNKLYTANYGDNTVSVIIRSGLSYAFERNISTRVLDGDTLRLSGPNGVSVSRDGRYVYVTNRNRTGGVPGHHGGTGGGFVSVIEVMTDQLIKTIELPPDAYSVITYP